MEFKHLNNMHVYLWANLSRTSELKEAILYLVDKEHEGRYISNKEMTFNDFVIELEDDETGTLQIRLNPDVDYDLTDYTKNGEILAFEAFYVNKDGVEETIYDSQGDSIDMRLTSDKVVDMIDEGRIQDDLEDLMKDVIQDELSNLEDEPGVSLELRDEVDFDYYGAKQLIVDVTIKDNESCPLTEKLVFATGDECGQFAFYDSEQVLRNDLKEAVGSVKEALYEKIMAMEDEPETGMTSR